MFILPYRAGFFDHFESAGTPQCLFALGIATFEISNDYARMSHFIRVATSIGYVAS